MQARTFLSVLLGVLVASGAWASTYIVRQDGSGDFAEIQEAIDHAAEGDVILVYPGHYQSFTLAKGVMVKAAFAPFEVESWVVIERIAPESRAGVSGAIVGPDPSSHPLLIVRDSRQHQRLDPWG
ncbi:MAG: hypothetical protein AB1486_09900 [Planctomycetota bacterium]